MQIRSLLRLFELDGTQRLKSLKVGEDTLRRPRYLRDLLFAYTYVVQLFAINVFNIISTIICNM